MEWFPDRYRPQHKLYAHNAQCRVMTCRSENRIGRFWLRSKQPTKTVSLTVFRFRRHKFVNDGQAQSLQSVFWRWFRCRNGQSAFFRRCRGRWRLAGQTRRGVGSGRGSTIGSALAHAASNRSCLFFKIEKKFTFFLRGFWATSNAPQQWQAPRRRHCDPIWSIKRPLRNMPKHFRKPSRLATASCRNCATMLAFDWFRRKS